MQTSGHFVAIKFDLLAKPANPKVRDRTKLINEQKESVALKAINEIRIQKVHQQWVLLTTSKRLTFRYGTKQIFFQSFNDLANYHSSSSYRWMAEKGFILLRECKNSLKRFWSHKT
jgi:hypothetical protein